MKVVRLSTLCTGRLYPAGNIPGSHFCWKLSRPQGHSAAGRIIVNDNASDTIGNLTRVFGSRKYKIKSYYGNLHNYVLLIVTLTLFFHDIKREHMRKHTNFGQKPS